MAFQRYKHKERNVNYAANRGKRGYVYLLENRPNDFIYKIGHTTRHDVDVRVREINQKGMYAGKPANYFCIHKKETLDCYTAEQMVHEELKEFRWKNGWELFTFINESHLKRAKNTIHEICVDLDNAINNAKVRENDAVIKVKISQQSGRAEQKPATPLQSTPPLQKQQTIPSKPKFEPEYETPIKNKFDDNFSSWTWTIIGVLAFIIWLSYSKQEVKQSKPSVVVTPAPVEQPVDNWVQFREDWKKIEAAKKVEEQKITTSPTLQQKIQEKKVLKSKKKPRKPNKKKDLRHCLEIKNVAEFDKCVNQ